METAVGRLDQAEKVLNRILNLMDLESEVSSREDEDQIVIGIETPDHQLLIGKNGVVLDAIQFLVNRIVGRTHPGEKRIMVDCARYRERRTEQLVKMAHQVAMRVEKERIPYAFDSTLTAAERRIIHMELKSNTSILTVSEGENEDRRLVVMPQSDDE